MAALSAQHMQKGFSLLEMIVVVTIIAIMSSLLLPNFSSWGETSAIEAARHFSIFDVRKARTWAQTGRICEETDCVSEYPNGYGISFSQSGTEAQYVLYAEFDGDHMYGVDSGTTQDVDIETIDLQIDENISGVYISDCEETTAPTDSTSEVDCDVFFELQSGQPYMQGNIVDQDDRLIVEFTHPGREQTESFSYYPIAGEFTDPRDDSEL